MRRQESLRAQIPGPLRPLGAAAVLAWTLVALQTIHSEKNRSNSMNKSRWLHAAKSGNLELIEQRLREGQNIETAGAWGRTALWTSAQAGHTEIVERLLAAGANPGAYHARRVPCRHLARATHPLCCP